MATMVFSKLGAVVSLAIVLISSKCNSIACSIPFSISSTLTLLKSGTPPYGPVHGFNSILSEFLSERSHSNNKK